MLLTEHKGIELLPNDALIRNEASSFANPASN
jgi:hypothetical protein